MRRAGRGAGWSRSGRLRHSSPTGELLVEFAATDPWRGPDGDVPDLALCERLDRAIFEDGGPRLRRSVRLLPRGEADWIEEYTGLVDALGASAGLLVGSWRGEAGGIAEQFGDPDVSVPLRPGTDLDLVVWRTSRPHLRGFLAAARNCPTVLATSEPGWVLIAPPSTDDMFLYPELSASD